MAKKVVQKEDELLESGLTLKQERFCINYTQNYEYFGNATLAYADAYGYDLDSMDDTDKIYLLKSGDEVDGETFKDLPSEQTHGAKLIKESTRKVAYDSCSQLGSRLRRNIKIQERCRDLLNDFMVNKVIDARLGEIIIKGAHADSLRAISEYNKLKQRIIDKKDITSGGQSIGGFNFIRNDEESSE